MPVMSPLLTTQWCETHRQHVSCTQSVVHQHFGRSGSEYEYLRSEAGAPPPSMEPISNLEQG